MKDFSPKVTVYVPCRNYGRYLNEALSSLVKQSMDSWEAIVFTEGSSDCTLEVAQAFQSKFPDQIHVAYSDTPIGLRGCANQALEMARGELHHAFRCR